MSAALVLIRHAQSVPPRSGVPDDPDRPLTSAGEAAARALVPELAALNPAAVLSSPLRRAIQTVQPTADHLGLPVITRHELREWDSGLVPSDDYADDYARAWADPAGRAGGGESLDELSARALAALRRIEREHPGRTVLIGSHGTFVSRALAALGHDVDWPFSRAMPMPAIYRVTIGVQ
ncbi:histidine phosphatase family protein [Lentzea tibetensis]|uniref:Histidine phosphatase family protein n=1 Tax=Lentzea tibetensis TaxID=2591470 RepID=A0A563F0I1_9PSEU|nr:histidine phosphatase family protein [Lentzea tibetensis]TWP53475.1 histidine phosphatase family protein [Lentzea tibetensis]